MTRWDGTTVPVESVAREWWSDSTKRSATFASVGTLTVPSSYTRLIVTELILRLQTLVMELKRMGLLALKHMEDNMVGELQCKQMVFKSLWNSWHGH